MARSARLAHFYMTGVFPEISDHIDGDGLNDRWSNLRECTHAQNSQNTKLRSNNTSGVKGVRWYARYGKWHAQVMANGVRFHIGYFFEREDAVRAYRKRASELFGEFMRME